MAKNINDDWIDIDPKKEWVDANPPRDNLITPIQDEDNWVDTPPPLNQKSTPQQDFQEWVDSAPPPQFKDKESYVKFMTTPLSEQVKDKSFGETITKVNEAIRRPLTPEVAFTPISKQLTGKSLSERTDFLNKASAELIKKSEKPISVTEAFIKQLPAATGQALVNLVDLTPADIGIMVATAGISQVPIKGIPIGELASKVPINGRMLQNVEELARYQATLKANLVLSSRGVPRVAPGEIATKVTEIPKQRIDLQTQVNLANTAADIVSKNPKSQIAIDNSQLLFRRVANALGQGELAPKDLPNVLKKYNLSSEDFAKLYVDNISQSGKELNVLSQLSKQIKQVLPDTPEIQATLSRLSDAPETAYQVISNAYKKIDNIRRASLVSQAATAMRNFISQSGRYALGMFDDAITGVAEKISGKPFKESFSPLKEDALALVRRFSPTQRKALNNVLAEYPIEEAKLISAPVQDVTLGGKYSRFINTLNSSQEYFFRKMSFDAKLTSLMERGGYNLKTVPDTAIGEAVDHALNMTFANAPKKGTAGNAILQVYDKVPFLTALSNPFPRFWTNSMKFLWDFSPGGFTKLLAPAFRKELVSSNNREAISALSKATLGTMMLGGGLALRNSKFGGEKWYEVRPDPDNNPGKVIDIRPFAPFSTYAFIGEAISHPDKLNGMDWLQGAIGINRIAGTGLVVVDMVRAGTPEKTVNKLKEFVGQYLGGFSVPLKTLQDTIAQFDKNERIVRSTKESPLTAPFIANIPYARQVLPPSPSLTRGGYFESENPLVRQLTGLSMRSKTPLEQEVDRLALENFYPRTGSKKFDRMIVERAGSTVNRIGTQLVNDPRYLRASDEDKKDAINEFLTKVKSAAKVDVKPQFIREEYPKLKTREEKIEFLEKYVGKPKEQKLRKGLPRINRRLQ